MKRSEVNKALTAYNPLIKKVLGEQEITTKHQRYEELRQQLRGKLALLMKEFDSWKMFRTVYRNPYLTKHLRAHCVLLLRLENEDFHHQLQSELSRDPHPDLKHQLQLTMIFLPLWSSFTGKERRFLLQLLTSMENQKMSHRSRQVYREQLKLDLEKLFAADRPVYRG